MAVPFALVRLISTAGAPDRVVPGQVHLHADRVLEHREQRGAQLLARERVAQPEPTGTTSVQHRR